MNSRPTFWHANPRTCSCRLVSTQMIMAVGVANVGCQIERFRQQLDVPIVKLRASAIARFGRPPDTSGTIQPVTDTTCFSIDAKLGSRLRASGSIVRRA